MQITAQTALTIVSALNKTTQNNTSKVNVANIINALQNIKSTTFATLTQASKVKTASAHKAQNIYKITVQNVTLCNSKANLYVNAVAKSTQEAFTALASKYTMLNNSYSVCALTSNTNKHYLRAVVNKALQVVYYCANTNTIVSKQYVAQFLTASAKAALLNTDATINIKHANVTHNVIVRNFALQNIYSINVAKQTLVCNK